MILMEKDKDVNFESLQSFNIIFYDYFENSLAIIARSLFLPLFLFDLNFNQNYLLILIEH